MHVNWRDCKAWRDAKLPLTCTNDLAVKLYDATLTQYVGWYDEVSVGGIEKSCEDMLKNDPGFVMGHVLANGLDVMGTGRSPKLDSEFKAALDSMTTLAEKSKVTSREKLHVDAILQFACGKQKEACDLWERILLDHPTDLLALKFAHDAYFYLGYQPQMRDSIARVYPAWTDDMPLCGYLKGMYSFGLVETNMFVEAEKVSRDGLELNPRDAWSTHSLAHVLEMTGRHKEGVAFLSSTVKDWEFCGMLACHNFWHWAVYHIERGEYQGALDIFDSAITTRAQKSGAMLDIVDACSMLYRLEMEGVKVGSRWKDLYDTCAAHKDDHLLVFNDCHLLMTFLRSQNQDTARQLVDGLRIMARENLSTQDRVVNRVGLALAEALVAYDEGDPARAVDLLLPVKYDVVTIGGSNAQRDVFSQFLIHAALKSNKEEHKALARHLVVERKALKADAPLTDRLAARAIVAHV